MVRAPRRGRLRCGAVRVGRVRASNGAARFTVRLASRVVARASVATRRPPGTPARSRIRGRGPSAFDRRGEAARGRVAVRGRDGRGRRAWGHAADARAQRVSRVEGDHLRPTGGPLDGPPRAQRRFRPDARTGCGGCERTLRSVWRAWSESTGRERRRTRTGAEPLAHPGSGTSAGLETRRGRVTAVFSGKSPTVPPVPTIVHCSPSSIVHPWPNSSDRDRLAPRSAATAGHVDSAYRE